MPFIFYSKNPFLNGREFLALGALESNNQIILNDEIKVRYEYEVCQTDWLGMINFDQPDLSPGKFLFRFIENCIFFIYTVVLKSDTF